MPVRWLKRFLMVCLSVCSAYDARPIAAQGSDATAPAAIIRGTVVGANGEPLPYAIVTISSLNLQQFTNQEGKFFFIQLRPGKYTVNVRQLGYLPSNREIALAGGATQDVSIRMERIVTRLATMQVAGEWACDRPGRPVSGASEQLLEVFEQLEQNALRLKLLAKEYPFVTVSERKIVMLRPDGSEVLDRLDSVSTASAASAGYKPGNVVQRTRTRGRNGDYFLQIPTLLDFADVAFQRTHCFLLRGIDSTGMGLRIRVDFQASSKLKSPDVAGSVFLEPGSFRLLSSEIRLTKIPEDIVALLGVRATTVFTEISRGLPAINSIVARTDYRTTGKNAASYPYSLEMQRTLSVAFTKKRPSDVPVPPQ